jgi:hypothetical protein
MGKLKGDGSNITIEGEGKLKESLSRKLNKFEILADSTWGEWFYSITDTGKQWKLLWQTEVKPPIKKDSVISISIMGFWSATNADPRADSEPDPKKRYPHAYLGAMINGESIHPAGDEITGAVGTQYEWMHPIGYTVIHRHNKDADRLGVGVNVRRGTLIVQGVQLYYLAFPPA